MAGKDQDRSVGIIRTNYKNKITIGKFVESLGPHIAVGDVEQRLDELDKDHLFEIFCHSQLRWERFDRKVPAYAFVAGHNEEGHVLHIGKTTTEGNNTVVGRVQDNSLYYTWKRGVHKTTSFEILVMDFCTHLKQCPAQEPSKI